MSFLQCMHVLRLMDVPVRFKHFVHLSLFPQEIMRMTVQNGSVELTLNILGFAGAQGGLPLTYTETLVQEPADGPKRAFLDIFYRRWMDLYFQIEFTGNFVLFNQAPFQNPCLNFLKALFFNRFERFCPEDRRDLLLMHVLLLKKPCPSLEVFETVLKALMGVSLSVTPFCGAWKPIDAADQTFLGGRMQGLGSRAWIQNAGVEICVSVTCPKRYTLFLPDGSDFKRLQGLVRALLPSTFSTKLRVRLNASFKTAFSFPNLLGRTSWIGAPQKNDFVFSLSGDR